MSYEEECSKLLESHKKEWESILEKYKDADKKYYEENYRTLDGKSPSHNELEKCRKQFNSDFKKIIEKYDIQK